jgi:hypothetical protein
MFTALVYHNFFVFTIRALDRKVFTRSATDFCKGKMPLGAALIYTGEHLILHKREPVILVSSCGPIPVYEVNGWKVPCENSPASAGWS